MTPLPVTTKRAARAKLRALGIAISPTFTISDFCSSLSKARNRPIRIVPVDLRLRAAPCGAWLATASTDYVCVDQTASALLREHIILHELSHIICDHRGATATDRVAPYSLLNPSTVQRMLERTLYDDAEEREAELLASAIGSRIKRDGPSLRTVDDDSLRHVIDGLAVVMGSGD